MFRVLFLTVFLFTLPCFLSAQWYPGPTPTPTPFPAPIASTPVGPGVYMIDRPIQDVVSSIDQMYSARYQADRQRDQSYVDLATVQGAQQGYAIGENKGYNDGFGQGVNNGYAIGQASGQITGANYALKTVASQFVNEFNYQTMNRYMSNLGQQFSAAKGNLISQDMANYLQKEGSVGGANANTNIGNVQIARPASGSTVIVNSASLQLNDQAAALVNQHTATKGVSTGTLVGIVIGCIVGGFLLGAVLVFAINLYTRKQLSKQARASVTKPNPNNIPALATGNNIALPGHPLRV